MSQDNGQILADYDQAEKALIRHELEWWCAPPNRAAAVHAVAGGGDEHQALVEAVEALDAAREKSSLRATRRMTRARPKPHQTRADPNIPCP